MQIHITKDGKQLGPYDEEQLAAYLENGQISYDDLAWVEGMTEWQPLAQIISSHDVKSSSPFPQPQTPCPPITNPVTKANQSEVIGYAMLAVPAVAALLIWLSDISGTLYDLSLSIVAVIITAILASIEAKQLGMGIDTDRKPNGKKRSGPGAWAASILLVWMVGFPSYLYSRSRYGVRNLFIPAVVVTLAFLGSSYLVGNELPAVDAPEVVEAAQSAIRESPAIKLSGETLGPLTIANPGEISYDKRKQKRVARAVLKSNLGSEVVYYTVEWQNRSKGIIWVQFQDHE